MRAVAARVVADPADPPLRWVSPEGDTARYPLEVDQHAMFVRDNPQPIYPADAMNARRAGDVLAELVVDRAGKPVVETIRVLQASELPFAGAVTRAARRMRWIPARLGGRTVPQVVQLPVFFRTAGDPPIDATTSEIPIVIVGMTPVTPRSAGTSAPRGASSPARTRTRA